MYGSGREFGFQLLEGNASGKLDLLHTAPPPFRVVLFLPRCFLQDPIFIEFSETILTLFWGDMWWESAYNGCFSRFEACVCLHGMIIRPIIRGEHVDVRNIRLSRTRH